MAIYHLSAKVLSRSSGRSVVAAAAYRSGSRLRDERTGRAYDFTRKHGVEYTAIVAPPRTPAWMLDRRLLWNGVENKERRRDAQLAREIEVSLPREIAPDRRISVVREFVENEFVSLGMVADIAVHEARSRDGNEQPHAHILLTTRDITAEGFGAKNREWNTTERLERWRATWADHVNQELERAGRQERVDHRSLEAQRLQVQREATIARQAGDSLLARSLDAKADNLDREPEPKLGPIATQIERVGKQSRRGDEIRDVQARNAERQRLREQAKHIARQIAETGRQLFAETHRHVQDIARRLDGAYRAAYGRAEKLLGSLPMRKPDYTLTPQIDLTSIPERSSASFNTSIIHYNSGVTRNQILGRESGNAEVHKARNRHDNQERER